VYDDGTDEPNDTAFAVVAPTAGLSTNPGPAPNAYDVVVVENWRETSIERTYRVCQPNVVGMVAATAAPLVVVSLT
jgi:hypothetical protein